LLLSKKHVSTQGLKDNMETKLARITEIARTKPEGKFTALYHHINVEMLEECHYEIAANKAPGIDKVTKTEYEANLKQNLNNLVEKLKQKSYRPQAVRRAYIPKGDGKTMRPLGISAYEDKLVQLALAKILQSIYEQEVVDRRLEGIIAKPKVSLYYLGRRKLWQKIKNYYYREVNVLGYSPGTRQLLVGEGGKPLARVLGLRPVDRSAIARLLPHIGTAQKGDTVFIERGIR